MVGDGKGNSIINKSVRKSDCVYLKTVDKKNSKVKTILEKYLFNNKDLLSVWNDGTILSVIPITTKRDMVLSRWGNGDFYSWHMDKMPLHPHKRIVTMVYYFNRVPQRFMGGSISFNFNGEIKRIETKHNKLVIFPSDLYHKVQKIRTASKDPADYRFSMNIWMGFK